MSVTASALRARPEDLAELERRRLLELVVAAVGRLLVGAPALERRAVAEAVALEVVVGDLGDSFHAKRLPRQVLAPIPARRRAGQPLPGGLRGLGPLGPFAPRMPVQGLAERLQLLREGFAAIPGEGRRDADAVQGPAVVEQPEEQRSNMGPSAVLMPPEAGNGTVGGALVLDLDHRPLPRLVRPVEALGDDAIEACALEAVEPVRGERAIGGRRGQVDRGVEVALERLLEAARRSPWMSPGGPRPRAPAGPRRRTRPATARRASSPARQPGECAGAGPRTGGLRRRRSRPRHRGCSGPAGTP